MKERVKNNLNILIRYNRTINRLCSLLGISELGILDEISAAFGEYVLMDMDSGRVLASKNKDTSTSTLSMLSGTPSKYCCHNTSYKSIEFLKLIFVCHFPYF